MAKKGKSIHGGPPGTGTALISATAQERHEALSERVADVERRVIAMSGQIDGVNATINDMEIMLHELKDRMG